MTMVKKTVTLDAALVDEASKLSDGNLSAYVNEALARRVRHDGLAQLLADDIAERGPIDPAGARATLASIDSVWDS